MNEVKPNKRSMLVALLGFAVLSPTFWLDRRAGGADTGRTPGLDGRSLLL
jgi:hypothetical protein